MLFINDSLQLEPTNVHIQSRLHMGDEDVRSMEWDARRGKNRVYAGAHGRMSLRMKPESYKTAWTKDG